MSANSKDPMKIIFAGTPDFAAVALKALIEYSKLADSDYEVIAVYTQPDRPAGRGRKLTPSAVKSLATAHEFPVFQPASLKAAEVQAELRSLNADVMVVAAYGLLLPKSVLEIPRNGCINIHGSLLPRWRGAAPIHRALIAGDKETGITIMQMDEGLDTGDMLVKQHCPILETDTTASLHDQLAVMGGKLLIEALNQLQEKKLQPEKQSEELATYANKLSKAEAEIDWTKSAQEIDRLIRGLNPWPVAQTNFSGKKLRIWMSKVTDTESNKVPGSILSANKKGIDVATGDGVVRITLLQMPGKKPMDAASFLNSHDVLNVQLGEAVE